MIPNCIYCIHATDAGCSLGHEYGTLCSEYALERSCDTCAYQRPRTRVLHMTFGHTCDRMCTHTYLTAKGLHIDYPDWKERR